MNYIKEAEKYLWYYRDIEKSSNYINKQIIKLSLKGCPNDVVAVSIDGLPHGSRHQEDMINIAYKLKMYMEMKEKTDKELVEINEILDDISKDRGCESYGETLRLWYIEKKQKEEIAEHMNYSKRNLYRIKDNAIKKFAIRLFGISVISAS